MNDAALLLLSATLLLSAGAAGPVAASGAPQGESRAANGSLANDDGTRRFSGTVVQPDGPVSGARVVFERVDVKDVVELKATTDDRGRFDFSIPADQIASPFGTRIVALKPGFGPAWIDPDAQQNFTDLRLTLAVDDLPIEGRILTLEGRPVVGATVRAVGIGLFANDDPRPYLAVLKANDGRASNYRPISWLRLVPFGDRSPSARSLFTNPDAEHPAVPTARTDERGVFRLTGVGRHRRALLVVSGNAIANTTIEVLTDPFEGLLNGQPPRFAKPTYGSRFVHHVRPSHPSSEP